MELDIIVRLAHITAAFHDSEAIVWIILDGYFEQAVAIATPSLKEVHDIENAMHFPVYSLLNIIVRRP